jgi:hypothetical protein
MNHPAWVRSIDAVEQMRAALKTFAEEVAVALADLGLNLNRAQQWLQYDRKEYWTLECRRAEQQVTEARINLERRRMFRIGDHEPSCDEEKKALEMARRRLEHARQKLEAVRRWSRLLERESTECRSQVASLAQWIETDAPRALALLSRLTGALESYVGLEMLERSQVLERSPSSPGEAVSNLSFPLGGEGPGGSGPEAGDVTGDENTAPHSALSNQSPQEP